MPPTHKQNREDIPIDKIYSIDSHLTGLAHHNNNGQQHQSDHCQSHCNAIELNGIKIKYSHSHSHSHSPCALARIAAHARFHISTHKCAYNVCTLPSSLSATSASSGPARENNNKCSYNREKDQCRAGGGAGAVAWHQQEHL